MKDSILLTKSKAFALRIVRLYKYLFRAWGFKWTGIQPRVATPCR